MIQARKEGYRLLLPDLQPLRNLASALKVRFRAEVAARRFDDALVTAGTMLALSRQPLVHEVVVAEFEQVQGTGAVLLAGGTVQVGLALALPQEDGLVRVVLIVAHEGLLEDEVIRRVQRLLGQRDTTRQE